MNWFRITNGVRQIWDDYPNIIALLALGAAVFAYLVFDARKCRKRRRDRHSRKY
jgi:hypothetical protein